VDREAEPTEVCAVATPVHIADDPSTRKRFYALHLASLDHWPASLRVVTPPFGLLLACDADHVASTVVADAADKVLASGARSIATWGPGCERVHDAIDEAYVFTKLEPPDQPDIVTTWHAGDSLDEAEDEAWGCHPEPAERSEGSRRSRLGRFFDRLRPPQNDRPIGAIPLSLIVAL